MHHSISQMKHQLDAPLCRFYFLQGHCICFWRKRPSSGVFKSSTAATGTCVIIAGKSSHLLIRAGTECHIYLPEKWSIPRNWRIYIFHVVQAIPTRNCIQYIIKVPSITSNLSHPSASSETIQHLSSSCTKLAQIIYKHWQVTKFFPQQLTKQLHLLNEPCFPHYKHEPQIVFENDTHKLHLNCDLLTNMTVPYQLAGHNTSW